MSSSSVCSKCSLQRAAIPARWFSCNRGNVCIPFKIIAHYPGPYHECIRHSACHVRSVPASAKCCRHEFAVVSAMSRYGVL